MARVTDPELYYLIQLQQAEREKVGPRFEPWRKPAPIKAACGGRGSGAKSWSVASLLTQKLTYSTKRWFCGREIQKTLEESSFSLIWDTIHRLGYESNWIQVPSRSRIINVRNGSYFYFAGLKDERSAKGLKGLEAYDGAWIDEAEDIPMDTWDILIPTFRKEGSELWVTFNRNREQDPAYKLFFVNPGPGVMSVELRPGRLDNPWFPQKLYDRMMHDYATRPDIAEHIWGGKPKNQNVNSVMTRAAIRAAMTRHVEAEGPRALGVDVARFGDDSTELYLRQGMKVIAHKTIRKQDTVAIAQEAWAMVNRDDSVPIKVDDTGVGGGVTDNLKRLGARVIPINFGASSTQPEKYGNLATEMWFEFPIDEVSLPDDEDLMDELSERRYDYDKMEVKTIESKKIFKARFGRSPDKADAVLMAFYTGKTIEYDEETRRALLARRNR